MTIEEFESLPDELALNHELVDGKLVDLGGNILAHHRLRDQLVLLTGFHVEQESLGVMISEQDFDFNGDVYGPDLSFIGIDNLPMCKSKQRVQPFVPDIAIEIASEPGMLEDILKKAVRYRRSGTSEVWVFSIENRVAFLLNEKQWLILDENQQFRSDLIPGFSIRIGELLDRL
jgi:Uma2 family endonuclease